MKKIILGTTSQIKIDSLKKLFSDANIISINCDSLKLPSQPIYDSIYPCGKARINWLKKQSSYDSKNYYMAIENGICDDHHTVFYEGYQGEIDKCVVLIEHNGILGSGESFPIPFDNTYMAMLEKHDKIIYNNKIEGYNITIGDLMHLDDPTIDSKNWMQNRDEQICCAIKNAFTDLDNKLKQQAHVLSKYKIYPDWPKQGVMFQDIFEVFKDKTALKQLVDLLVAKYKYDDIDVFIGLESRGFCLAPLLAYELGATFQPIRKPNKLPGDIISTKYEKEYGLDEFQMQVNTTSKNLNVVIVDDLLGTGGSIKAGINLCELLGMNVIDCIVIRDVPGLLKFDELKDKISVLIP